jgi:hypothetical protein
MTTPTQDPRISRRGIVASLGLAGAAGAATLFSPGQAQATPSVDRHGGPAPLGKGHDGVPAAVNPIASAPQPGFNYKFLTMWDFSPEHYSSGRAWSPTGGVYVPLGTGDNLWAVAELPAGAILGDVEWYLSATENVAMMGRLWVSGDAYLSATVADGTLAAGSALARAARIVPPAGTNGPFPHGTALVLGVWTPHTGNVSINGVRIGYKLGGTREVLLPTPARLYDSRPGTKIGRLQTRTHSLASRLPVGATGAILNVTLTGTEKAGNLTVYSAGSTVPAASSINWSATGQAIANGVHTAVSSARAIKVTCGGTTGAQTDYLIDLVGYLV